MKRILITTVVSLMLLAASSAQAITGHRATVLASRYNHDTCGTLIWWKCESVLPVHCLGPYPLPTGVDNGYFFVQWKCSGIIVRVRKVWNPFLPARKTITRVSEWDEYGNHISLNAS